MSQISFDSNVLVYSADNKDPRQDRAIEVLERAMAGAGMLCIQALGEFFHVVVRKNIISRALAEQQVEDWMEIYEIRQADALTLREAIAASRDHHMQFWDAMLWATIKAAGCRVLLTEDLQDGRDLGGVRFVNPFDSANDAIVDLILPPLAAGQ